MKRIAEIFRGDGLNVSSSVFPDINTDRIATDLDLVGLGKQRGGEELPGQDEKSPDSVELSAIERVEEVRRKGLENYDENRRVYARRLAKASEAHVEVKNIAESARSEFMTLVMNYRAEMALPVKNAREWNRALHAFEQKNRLERPSFQPMSGAKTVAIILFGGVRKACWSAMRTKRSFSSQSVESENYLRRCRSSKDLNKAKIVETSSAVKMPGDGSTSISFRM